jgi:hypothetical protein
VLRAKNFFEGSDVNSKLKGCAQNNRRLPIMTHKSWLTVCGVFAMLTSLVPSVQGQVPLTRERFSFSVASGTKAGSGGDGRFELSVARWSTDAERDQMITVFKEQGQSGLRNAISNATAGGRIKLPGGLENTVRYARRSPRPDGGEDIVLVFDWRTIPWWDATLPASSLDATFSVIQLRLTKAGTGEGKLAVGKLREDKATGVVMADYDAQPALLLDVRREATK